MSESKTVYHVCVLCNAKLESKEALQEHFRKHANREIDGKGRPRKAKVPGGIVGYGSKKNTIGAHQNSPRVSVQTQPTSNDAPATSPSNSISPTVAKATAVHNVPPAGGAKSSAKSSTGIVCDVCGQEFETVTIAIQHKFKKHPDSAIKHFCPHCGQQFPLKINRDKHLQVHPSTPPSQLFPCQECGVIFYNAQAQNYHFKSTHKRIVAIFKPVETPPPSKKIRVNNAGEAQSVYYCHICGYEYIIKFNLQKHIERHHPEKERNAIPEGIIKCTTCDALFYSKRAYDNHNMYHRPDDLYVTSEEQRLQTVSRVDQDFDIRRVQPGPDKFIPVNRPRPSRVNLALPKIDSKKRGFLRKCHSQKKRKKGSMLNKEDTSDESDGSDTSSEMELSPDSSGPESSDSDVPLKKIQLDQSKSARSRGGGIKCGSEMKSICKRSLKTRKKLKSETTEEPSDKQSDTDDIVPSNSNEGKACESKSDEREKKGRIRMGKTDLSTVKSEGKVDLNVVKSDIKVEESGENDKSVSHIEVDANADGMGLAVIDCAKLSSYINCGEKVTGDIVAEDKNEATANEKKVLQKVEVACTKLALNDETILQTESIEGNEGKHS